MTRFVDIRAQGTGYRFAFWDTVSDRFYEFDGDQAWDSVADFTLAFSSTRSAGADDLGRFLALIPEWADDPL